MLRGPWVTFLLLPKHMIGLRVLQPMEEVLFVSEVELDKERYIF